MNGVDLAALPDREALLGPVQLFGSWEPNPHPDVRKFRRRIEMLIRRLESIGAGKATMTVVELSPSEEDAKREEQAMYLDAARAVHAALESRTARIVEREAARLTPTLAPKLIRAREAAAYSLRQWRALLAFALEEGDDLELGISLVPAPPPIAAASKSVDFKF